jgi:hypothetical protein
VLVLALVTAHFAVAAEEQCITNGTNVRLRAAPQNTALITSELPLGTELSVLDRSGVASDPWLRVRTNDGRDGWVLGRLTTKIDPQRYDEMIESVVLDQLKKEAELSGTTFEARVQLFDLIERRVGRAKDREQNARFGLYRLRSMQHVFSSVPFQGNNREPFRSWIAKHEDAARYNSPAGAWMVDPEYTKRVHDSYHDAQIAEDIAWFYVENGLSGECEGDVPCYVSWTNQLEGWYLRTHPTGSHADDANAQVAVKLNGAMDNLQSFPRVLAEFDPIKRCGELHTSLDPLAAAVSASVSSRSREALAAIDRFAKLCR